MEDRRIFSRISVSFQLKFLDLNSGKAGEAETVDISANGVGFVTKEILSERTPLEMWLIIPDHHEPFYTQGEVVWSQALNGDDLQRVGVQLRKEDFIGVARALWIKNQNQ